MARYIDADSLLKRIFPYDLVDKKQYALNAQSVYNAIESSSAADVVPVVRCKDCKRFVDNKEARVQYCTRELKNLRVKPDDFCSYGERKEQCQEERRP